MASSMAANAFAIDAMLPGLGDMARSLSVANANHMQLVVGIFLLSSAIGAVAAGPLADRYGRRPVMITGLALFNLSTLGCMVSTSFELLLFFRFCQGILGASCAVLPLSVVRDRFTGDAMARATSVIFAMFMIVPIVAPTLGQVAVHLAGWRASFGLILAGGGMLLIWMFFRLPETLRPQSRRAIEPAVLIEGWKTIVRDRVGIGYMAAIGVMMSAFFAFISSMPQIVGETFHLSHLFFAIFAATSIFLAAGNIINSRVVARFGARRVSHIALILLILLSTVDVVVQWVDGSFWQFFILISLKMMAVGFCLANFGALAMGAFGHMAGAAASFQAAIRLAMGGIIGALIGQMYDGTALPLAIGFLLCGLAALSCVLYAEKGRLLGKGETGLEAPGS